jgi:hypothetical protein
MVTYAETPDQASGFLVPVLPTEAGPPDAVSVAAWHLALSNLIGVVAPHDLLALWLFPMRGGVMLLAPSELAADQIELQAPEGRLSQHALLTLEERIRRAGYKSVLAVPVRGPARDLGLALFARLEAGHLGPPEAIRLHAVVQQLVPTFLALVEAPPLARTAPLVVTETNVVEAVARAAAEGRTVPEVLRLVSGALHALVPHELLDVAALRGAEGSWTLLSEAHEGCGAGETAADVAQAIARLVARAAPAGILMVSDLREAGLRWPAYQDSRRVTLVRSVAGVRLTTAGAADAWLLVGGQAPGMYRDPDLAVLRSIAPVVAIRVHGLRAKLDPDTDRAPVPSLHRAPHPAVHLASELARLPPGGPVLAALLRCVQGTIGFARARLVLHADNAQVIEQEADQAPNLGQLPPSPLDTHPLAPVLRGTTPVLWVGAAQMAVPLCVGGRIIGALHLEDRVVPPEQADEVAQAATLLADLVAPHVELMHRAALGDSSPASAFPAHPPATE